MDEEKKIQKKLRYHHNVMVMIINIKASFLKK